MIRQKIFIGEADNLTVYYDVRTRKALIADKNILLNTEGAAKTNAYIPSVMGLGVLLATVISFIGLTDVRYGYYSPNMIPFFIVGWLIVGLGFIWMMEMALYQHVKKTRPATREQFHHAIYTNLFWRNFNKKRVSAGKYALFLLVFVVLIPCTVILPIASMQGILHDFATSEKFDIQIFFSLLIPVFPGLVWLLLFQNNPFRWLNAVRQYERNKIVFDE